MVPAYTGSGTRGSGGRDESGHRRGAPAAPSVREEARVRMRPDTRSPADLWIGKCPRTVGPLPEEAAQARRGGQEPSKTVAAAHTTVISDHRCTSHVLCNGGRLCSPSGPALGRVAVTRSGRAALVCANASSDHGGGYDREHPYHSGPPIPSHSRSSSYFINGDCHSPAATAPVSAESVRGTRSGRPAAVLSDAGSRRGSSRRPRRFLPEHEVARPNASLEGRRDFIESFETPIDRKVSSLSRGQSSSDTASRH